MKKLYQKNELTFAILWIVAYVVLFSLADSLSESAGIPGLYTLFLCAAMATALLIFIHQNGLTKVYGLCRVSGSWREYLYFLPLILISTCNLWRGIVWPENPLKAVPAIVSLTVAGLLEELLFRGLLFKAMRRDNQKVAIIVGSLTFGIGHIVNLLTGADFLYTLLQVVYAVAIGYLFITIFLKSGSIVPCILSHCVINGTSVLGGEQERWVMVLISLLLAVIPLGYALWLNRKDENA